MIHVLMVDDEPLVRRGIVAGVDWAALGCEVVGEAQSGEEGIELARRLKPELIITDIRMPKMDGITMMNLLREEGCAAHCIVLTAHSDFEYARGALLFGADDYLLKPFDPDRIREALERSTVASAALVSPPPLLHRIAVSSNRSTTLLDIDEITHIETDGVGRGCVIHTTSGKTYNDSTSLGEYEGRLAGQAFYRIHKTCLVHLRYIVSIFPWTGNSFALRVRSTDSVLPISRERVRELRRRLNI